MSFKAEMFNRKAADPQNHPDKVIEVLKIMPGDQVADIGSGGGYYAFRFAEIVGRQGKVFAADTNKKLLSYIGEKAGKKGLTNISLVLLGEKDLPGLSLDLIFMRNVTHHLKDRVNYFRQLKKNLKPEARVAIIDYSQHRKKHHLDKGQLVGEMSAAGYELITEHKFLKDQHFTIYRAK